MATVAHENIHAMYKNQIREPFIMAKKKHFFKAITRILLYIPHTRLNRNYSKLFRIMYVCRYFEKVNRQGEHEVNIIRDYAVLC